MDTAYHPDFGANVRYEFERMPEDPDAQVRMAVRKVIGYLRADVCSPIIQEMARRALELGNGNPIAGVWKSVKSSMRFQHDDVSARRLEVDDARKEDVVEVFIRPVDQALMIMLRGMGFEDCDGYEMYAGCLLTALGVPCALVTIAAEPERPEQFSHVYIAAYVHGKRIPLDFSHGPHPGWEAPNLGRIKEWPIWETAGERFCRLAAPVAALGAAYLALKWIERRGIAA